MSHEIDMSNGKANMAFIGSRSAIWHGLGQELSENADIDTWKVEAGMDWVVLGSPVRYIVDTEDEMIFPNKKVLYRSDNKAALSIVSENYKIVHPGEVLEFFRDLTEDHGMKLSTAGCLFGGQRFWALAETGMNCQVINNDTIKGHLLFITSVDGTLSSTAKFVSTRVVCNNTLTIALKETSKKHIVKKNHRSVWDNTKAKIDLGLLDNSWQLFMENLKKLSQRKMSKSEIREFFEKTSFDPEKDVQGWGAVNRLNTLHALYDKGAGAEMGYGTAYGALNAVTNYFTHGTGRKGSDRAFWSAYVDSDNEKGKAMNTLLELC